MSYNNVTDWTAAIADAIRSKDGSSELINHQDFPARISAIPQGSIGGAGTGDVRFLDYDGTIVQAYTASEFASLESLPSNPTHSGLTAQGWNWSLTDAKSYVATHGQLDIGQMYVTDDGKTRIYVSLTEGTLTPILGLGVNGSVDVDWGDGTEHSTLTGASLTTAKDASHVYATAGDYVIALTVTGSARIYGTNSITHIFKNTKNSTQEGNYKYLNAIHSVRLGTNINLAARAFMCCYSLESISIPNTVTSIGTSAFNYCYSLASISIPNTVTSIGQGAFGYCYSLASISISNTVTSIGSGAFQYCYGLETLVVPATTATLSANAFASTKSLEEVTFLGTPTTMTATVFSGCTKLTTINVPWSEGDVANAPWGATNATINYDYTG